MRFQTSNHLPRSFNKRTKSTPQISISKLEQSSSSKQKRILLWSDSVASNTGFSIVSRHIAKALYSTGLYEIDQLAINFSNDFYDKKEFPYNILPARLGDPRDPYGQQMFLNALIQQDYDIVLVINDHFVVHNVSQKIEEIKAIRRSQGRKVFKLVYYYPVDCRIKLDQAGMLQIADRAVAYTNFAKQITKKDINLEPSDVIYHGVDTQNFFPLTKRETNINRFKYLQVPEDVFVIINANRNSMRKDIARSIFVFKEFKKIVPNSLLYLHCALIDHSGQQQIDLTTPIRQLGLTAADVKFPKDFNPAKGFPIQIVNHLFNCADVCLNTTTSEGFGLIPFELMAAGTPSIIGNHTVIPELIGSERGYIYPVKEPVYLDNQGYRFVGRTEDILNTLLDAYNDWKINTPRRQKIIEEGFKFVKKHTWENIGKQWINLFSELDAEIPTEKSAAVSEMV